MFMLPTKASPNMCNGTYDSFCGRDEKNQCLLYAHNDHRGGLTFDSLSGWGVFELKGLKHGQVFVKMDSWRRLGDNPSTDGWTEVNNGWDGHRELAHSPYLDSSSEDQDHEDENHRKLGKKKGEDTCPEMHLDFAINGKIIKSLEHKEILAKPNHLLAQRVVQIWPVLDDPDMVKDGPIDVEFAVRMRGCSREYVFWVTHIYWA